MSPRPALRWSTGRVLPGGSRRDCGGPGETFNSNTINLAAGVTIPALLVTLTAASTVARVDVAWLLVTRCAVRLLGLVQALTVDGEDVALGDPADDRLIGPVQDPEAVLAGVAEGSDRVVERVLGVDQWGCVGEVAGGERSWVWWSCSAVSRLVAVMTPRSRCCASMTGSAVPGPVAKRSSTASRGRRPRPGRAARSSRR